MDIYRKYERSINQVYRGKPRIVGLKTAVSKWLAIRKQQQPLHEIFQIEHGKAFRQDLIQFLRNEFAKGNIRSIHAGLSTTDYKANDWIEEIANDLFNRLIQYLETTRSQTERDMYSPVPIEND